MNAPAVAAISLVLLATAPALAQHDDARLLLAERVERATPGTLTETEILAILKATVRPPEYARPEAWLFAALTTLVGVLARWVWVTSRRGAEALALVETLPAAIELLERLVAMHTEAGHPDGRLFHVSDVLKAIVAGNLVEERSVLLLKAAIRILVLEAPADLRETVSRIEADLRDELLEVGN